MNSAVWKRRRAVRCGFSRQVAFAFEFANGMPYLSDGLEPAPLAAFRPGGGGTSAGHSPIPTGVRYAWAANPVLSVENKAGLPLRPFRDGLRCHAVLSVIAFLPLAIKYSLPPRPQSPLVSRTLPEFNHTPPWHGFRRRVH